jgi:hypothetical protein
VRDPQNETLWTFEKAGNPARAVARKIPGVGIEVRFLWNSELRQGQVYRDLVEAAAASSEKRKELVGSDSFWFSTRSREWLRASQSESSA